MSIETISTIAGIVIAAFVFGQYYAHGQQTKRELAEACRRSEGPGRCGRGMKCDHHGPPEIAYARQAQRMLEQCIASKDGPDRSCPLGYRNCTHHPKWIWIREGVDYQWQWSSRRRDGWVKKSEWIKEQVEDEALYSRRPAAADVEPAVVNKPKRADSPRKTAKAKIAAPAVLEARRRRQEGPPRIEYPPLAREDRCAFQSVGMGMAGHFLARCRLEVDHDGDHVVADGGCLGGTRTVSQGAETAPVTDDGEFQPEPLLGDGDPCPVCGADDGGVLATRMGPFASFLRCRRHPACVYAKHPEDDPIEPLPGEGNACPKCGKTSGGTLATRRARRTGERFLGCTKYPRCDYDSRPASLAAPVAEPI